MAHPSWNHPQITRLFFVYFCLIIRGMNTSKSGNEDTCPAYLPHALIHTYLHHDPEDDLYSRMNPNQLGSKRVT